jgi:hypothetical protein
MGPKPPRREVMEGANFMNIPCARSYVRPILSTYSSVCLEVHNEQFTGRCKDMTFITSLTAVARHYGFTSWRKVKGCLKTSRGANIPSVFRGDKVVYALFYLWKLRKEGKVTAILLLYCRLTWTTL